MNIAQYLYRPLVLMLIVLFAAGCGQDADRSQPDPVTNGQTVTVLMTNQGFEPPSLSIQKGTKVSFVNSDAKDRWPASDFHPTHGIYPEFDPQANVIPGASWNFVFDRMGKWRYHDHLLPSFTGVIEVTE